MKITKVHNHCLGCGETSTSAQVNCRMSGADSVIHKFCKGYDEFTPANKFKKIAEGIEDEFVYIATVSNSIIAVLTESELTKFGICSESFEKCGDTINLDSSYDYSKVNLDDIIKISDELQSELNILASLKVQRIKAAMEFVNKAIAGAIVHFKNSNIVEMTFQLKANSCIQTNPHNPYNNDDKYRFTCKDCNYNITEFKIVAPEILNKCFGPNFYYTSNSTEISFEFTITL